MMQMSDRSEILISSYRLSGPNRRFYLAVRINKSIAFELKEGKFMLGLGIAVSCSLGKSKGSRSRGGAASGELAWNLALQ